MSFKICKVCEQVGKSLGIPSLFSDNLRDLEVERTEAVHISLAENQNRSKGHSQSQIRFVILDCYCGCKSHSRVKESENQQGTENKALCSRGKYVTSDLEQDGHTMSSHRPTDHLFQKNGKMVGFRGIKFADIQFDTALQPDTFQCLSFSWVFLKIIYIYKSLGLCSDPNANSFSHDPVNNVRVLYSVPVPFDLLYSAWVMLACCVMKP